MTAIVKPNTSVDKLKATIAVQEQPTSLDIMIRKATSELSKALPAHMSPERLVRIALTCIRQTPELAKCTPASFLGSLFTAASLGLEPVAGRCFLIPFRNRRKVGNDWVSVSEVQLVVGVRGWTELFYRHQDSISLDVQEVCANDTFEYEFGTDSFLKHRPARGDRGDVTYIYAVAKLKGGGTLFKVMTYEECLAHGRNHSKTWDDKAKKFYDSSPWSSEPLAMCKKTVILQLAKLLPLSMEVSQAIAADETSRNYKEGIDSALDMPTNAWKEVEPDEKSPLPITDKPVETEAGSFQEFTNK
jgi:recombination protein RecT